MNEQPQRRFYIVHDEKGRILGLAPIVMEQVNERVRLGYRLVPGPGQRVTEIALADEHVSLLPHELLDFEVVFHPETGQPHLRHSTKI